MSRPYVHLHVHSEFSMLDGLGTIGQYVARAVELGQPALALTDHGTMCGIPEFYHKARKAGLEPIIGEEFYFVPDASYRPPKGESVERYHVVLLARGEPGYRLLAELSTEAHRNYWYKPLLDRSLLERLGKDARHLVCLSGCAGSIISRAVQAGDMVAARREVVWWREIFPHFYIELQHHDTDFDRRLNAGLLKLARRYSVPWVVTNDPHYVMAEDECYHDTLLAIQTSSNLDDEKRLRFDGTGYHLRSRAEMHAAFRRYGEEVWKPGAANTLRVAKLCETRLPMWESRTWHIPAYPDCNEPYKELLRRAKRGLLDRGLHRKTDYVKRMYEELYVIKKAGIADFLLITADIIDYARQQGIPVGPGRGSVCGTLVGYLVGIHKIDPVRYDLMFARFLNPDRPRLPDIDTDFGQARRQEMFEYVERKYGIENVVKVATFGTMKVKKTFQSLARVHGMPYPEMIAISKTLGDDEEEVEGSLPPDVLKRYPDLIEQLRRLVGTKSAFGKHPAGVLIASPEFRLKTVVPQMRIAEGEDLVGQFDLNTAEETGLLKEDFLGLRTLDTINLCVQLIEQRTGEKLDPDSWVPDEEPGDDGVYAMLAEGRTAGVFQMEGPANQRGCRDVQPKCFEDVVSITALYRTGPIKAGFPKQFIANRDRGRVHWPHPALKRHLGATWGVILYQEQVMSIAHELAGFDMVKVDEIKEAIKHKKSDLMISMRTTFMEGCRRAGIIGPEIAKMLWDAIEGYSGYSYNRSHAVAYTFLTYQTARLKKWHPLEFFCALLATVDDKEKRQNYFTEAVASGYRIAAPDINRSSIHARPLGRRTILLGFTDYSGIGEAQAHAIIENRPRGGYTKIRQVEKSVNAKTLEILRHGSALRRIKFRGKPIKGNLARTEELLNWHFHDPMIKYRERFGHLVKLPASNGDDVILCGQIFKAQRGTTRNNKPYMTWKIRWSLTESWDIRLWSETQELWDLPVGAVVRIIGVWEARWLNVSVGDVSQVKVIHDPRRVA